MRPGRASADPPRRHVRDAPAFQLPDFIQTLYLDFSEQDLVSLQNDLLPQIARSRTATATFVKSLGSAGHSSADVTDLLRVNAGRCFGHGGVAAAQGQRVGPGADIRAAVDRSRAVPDDRASRPVRLHGEIRRRVTAARLPATARAHRRVDRPARGVRRLDKLHRGMSCSSSAARCRAGPAAAYSLMSCA